MVLAFIEIIAQSSQHIDRECTAQTLMSQAKLIHKKNYFKNEGKHHSLVQTKISIISPWSPWQVLR